MIPKRLFLYTYTDQRHYERSVEKQVFGARTDKPGLSAKVNRLRVGDLIVLRDASDPYPRFLGTCVLTGSVRSQEKSSEYPDFLWPEEELLNRLIFRLRAPAEFRRAPRIGRQDVGWEDLGALNVRGDNGRLMRTSQQWGQKLYGNFLRSEPDITAFTTLLRIAL